MYWQLYVMSAVS